MLQGFPPVVGTHPHTLILGSMPGAASLEAGRYYAHPRNAFWPVVAASLGFDPGLPYESRVEQLIRHGYALWDVLGACRRNGSLDSEIEAHSMQTNDVEGFLGKHPGITRILFNGGTAERIFKRQILPSLAAHPGLSLHRLPSTSPANAAQSFARKRDAWRELLR